MANPRMRPSSAAGVSPAEFHILLALADADLHGYAIMQRVAADSGGEIQLGPGTLYTAVKRLLEAGLIREVESRVDPELDDARRRYYRLTASGRSAAAVEARYLETLVERARARQLFATPSKAKAGRS